MFKRLFFGSMLFIGFVSSIEAKHVKDQPVVDIESVAGSVKVGNDGVSIKADGIGSVNVNAQMDMQNSDPEKVCGDTKLPRIVIHAKMSPITVNADSVQAQAAAAISQAGVKTNVDQTPVAVCLMSDAAGLQVDLGRLNLGRLDVRAAAGTVDAILPGAGTPTGRLVTDTGTITLQVPRSMGVVLSGNKSGYGAVTLDRNVARQGDKTHRANFTATTTAGIIQITPISASENNDEDTSGAAESEEE
jgi:hypothetical protein